jgi:hypothetical protein
VVVNYLLSCGVDAWGVDLATPSPIKGAGGRLFTGIAAQDLPASYRSTIDALMFLDVIEHIEDAQGFLRETIAAFPNASATLITVPARLEAWSNYDTYYGHYRRYTTDTLRRELIGCGLTPIRIRYLFHSLYYAAMAINLAGVKRKVVLQPPRRVALHRGVAAYLWLESKFLSPLCIVPGLSLVAIAKRSPPSN